MRQDLDAGGLDDDNEWRLSSRAGGGRVGLEEGGLATADAHANEQDGENVCVFGQWSKKIRSKKNLQRPTIR